MFKTHQPKIAKFARQSPENFAKVMQFVILSIRVPLYRVPQDMQTAEDGGEASSGVLYGWKHKAYTSAELSAERTLSYLEHVNDEDISDDDKARIMLAYLAELPGLDYAKAGFVIQLCYGLAGCIDAHNLTRFNVKEMRGFKRLKTAKGRRKNTTKYIALTKKLGGAQSLWDSWCEFVAAKYPITYNNAEHVSRIHCEALGIT